MKMVGWPGDRRYLVADGVVQRARGRKLTGVRPGTMSVAVPAGASTREKVVVVPHPAPITVLAT